MKKILGITFGGLQRRILSLVLILLIATMALFAVVVTHQNRLLSNIVKETNEKQQLAISGLSEENMHSILADSLIKATKLQAEIADNDFSEVVNDVYMLRTMAWDLFKKRSTLEPAVVNLPDPTMDGKPSAMVLYEEGVDYTQSRYLGIVGHMAGTMIALWTNSEKIDGCYIGLVDGTDLCVDDKAGNKLDENGNVIPFPIRQRPWYIGALKSGNLYFTGLIEDAFSGKYLVTCSAPLIYQSEIIGVIGIDIVPESMNNFIISSDDKEGDAYVINNRGEIIVGPAEGSIFNTDGDVREQGNEEFNAFLKQALRETTDLVEITVNGKVYYMVGAPMPTVGWTVISVVDKDITEESEKALLAQYDEIKKNAEEVFRKQTNGIRWGSYSLMVVILLTSIFGAMFAAKQIARPIEDMTATIVKSSDSGQPFEMKDSFRTNDEIEQLAVAFDDLSKRTRQYIQEITEITRDKERVSTELQMANEIQSNMLPHTFPPYPDRTEFDLYATMDPAREVGGDFYDFFLIDDDHLCMVMADVSGKGVPAALFMTISKVILQSHSMNDKTPKEILSQTNDALCSDNQSEMFVTVWLGILEISTGKIVAANAGHEYPIMKKNGRFELIKDKHGFVIGGMSGIKYKEYELQMEPGDKLFLYTDGVPEATDADQKMFGIERLLQTLNESPEDSPKQILENVRKAVETFVNHAEQFDDVTMLCMEYKGKESTEGVKNL